VCTLVVLRRPNHDWPLLVGGNRDEMRDRPWAAPARHWSDRPEVVAGLDELGEGSWFGINDHGVVAAVMNREGTLGPEAGMRSRGELVLEALDHAQAAGAMRALTDIDPRAYRGFNLFVGDPVTAFWLRHRGDGSPAPVEAFPVDEGLHMLSARDLDDTTSARLRVFLPQFRDAGAPDPERGEWRTWRTLLASRLHPAGEGPLSAMNLELPGGFGTVCSQLVAVPRYPGFDVRPVFLFAGGPPDQAEFVEVVL
jgi:uncharacterized protein with NRDE domain